MCRTLNYFEFFLVFVSAVCGCVSISAFAPLVGISVDYYLNVCALAAGIKKVSQYLRKKKDNIVHG